MSNYTVVLRGPAAIPCNAEVQVDRFQLTVLFATATHYKVTELQTGIVYAPTDLYEARGVVNAYTELPLEERAECVNDFRGFARVLRCRVLSSMTAHGLRMQTELLLEPIAAPSR